jgi:hypothetical protein
MSIEAMKQALEFIDSVKVHPTQIATRDALHTALCAAIEEAEKQEPVGDNTKRLLAWIIDECLVYPESEDEKQFANRLLSAILHPKSGYTAQPTAPRQWVGLTDEEIAEIWRDDYKWENEYFDLPRAVEAKLKEKNT